MHDDLLKAFSLEGRVAVVTGAASGIGRETACVLAEAGARVMLADVDESGLAETARLVEARGGAATARRTDVGDRDDIEALATAAAGVSIWVNAAGILVTTPIIDAPTAETERQLAINMMGTYWACAAAARAMRDGGNGGAIVNLSSAGADMPSPGLSAYSMAKAAVNMLTRTAAVEFGPLGIRVNAVAPGFIDTPMVTYRFRDAEGGVDAAKRDDVFRQRAQGSPLGLTGTPRDIALAILYLASDASRFVTGQIVRPNGGVVMP
ncbi:SDR family NAD(P)-dependent oxidoreductase [Sphingomonas solaris]|uniref:SDR family oxidoreductase n=1 Tax=Alterirhizorhabdus solaris TaxID=2529389 RepID=A0A558RBH7_9SPHN|nr:SDR family oxidoreductase [Sphingomonas solaris]TVV76710.1 SDR family oxidoreductase [Sphingomonas solaris]